MRRFLVLVVACLLPSCAVEDKSYFVGMPEEAGAGAAFSNAGHSVAEGVLVIWTDGSPAQRRPQFCPESEELLPRVIRDLGRSTTRSGGHISIFVHCPTVLGNFDWRTRTGKGKAERVAEHLSLLIDGFVARGVEPGRIFLAGQSSGGWASLLAARALAGRIGGAIAFAPADHGDWKPLILDSRDLTGWTLLKSLNFNDMLDTSYLPAMVFAFYGDPYSSPRELAILTRIKGVRVDTVSSRDFEAIDCKNYYSDVHDQARSPCFAELFGPQILDYINRRLRKSG